MGRVGERKEEKKKQREDVLRGWKKGLKQMDRTAFWMEKKRKKGARGVREGQGGA